MAQSLSNVLLHIVFSTKDRRPFLQDAELRTELHAVIMGMLRNRNCPGLTINSVEDHIHILCQLSRTMSMADLLQEIKAASSRWIKDQRKELQEFQWQGGYAVFSVSQSQVPQVVAYIDQQEEHHRRLSFKEELLALLQKNGIDFDENYLWD
jgi:putative transposase